MKKRLPMIALGGLAVLLIASAALNAAVGSELWLVSLSALGLVGVSVFMLVVTRWRGWKTRQELAALYTADPERAAEKSWRFMLLSSPGAIVSLLIVAFVVLQVTGSRFQFRIFLLGTAAAGVGTATLYGAWLARRVLGYTWASYKETAPGAWGRLLKTELIGAACGAGVGVLAGWLIGPAWAILGLALLPFAYLGLAMPVILLLLFWYRRRRAQQGL